MRQTAPRWRTAGSGEATMKTSIATVSLSGDLEDKIAAIARAGFDGVEIFEQDFIALSLIHI